MRSDTASCSYYSKCPLYLHVIQNQRTWLYNCILLSFPPCGVSACLRCQCICLSAVKKAPTPGFSQSVHSVSYSEISSNTFEVLSTYPTRTTSNSHIHKSTIVPLILIFVPGVRHQHAHFQHLILALPPPPALNSLPPPSMLAAVCVCPSVLAVSVMHFPHLQLSCVNPQVPNHHVCNSRVQ